MGVSGMALVHFMKGWCADAGPLCDQLQGDSGRALRQTERAGVPGDLDARWIGGHGSLIGWSSRHGWVCDG